MYRHGGAFSGTRCFPYFKGKWNHVIYTLDLENMEIGIRLNNVFKTSKLPSDFKIHPHYEYIRISDFLNKIKISSIIIFDSLIDSDTSYELFYNGFKTLDLIKNKKGLVPTNLFNFKTRYSKNVILDYGRFLNHLQTNGEYSLSQEIINTTSEIYLPIRLDSIYKSLVHDDDSNIIQKYYKYDPDIQENADIFFYDVIPNKLDYKSIGLNTLKYTLLDKQERSGYELIRIVT